MTVRAFPFSIPGGDAGTRRTLKAMRQLARVSAYDPQVRRVALDITNGIAGKNSLGQIAALDAWLRRMVRFTRDPRGAELLIDPRTMIREVLTVGGPLRLDCDDAATLSASLGLSIGLRARFVVVAFLSPTAPYAHVWTELSAPSGPGVGVWKDVDVTRDAQPIPVANISRRLTVEV